MKLLYSFLSYLKNLNLLKLQKHPFYFISETDVKMAKETQRRHIVTRQSNKTHLILLDTNISVLTGFISLYFLQHLLQEYEEHET